jgi:hypothetical protein
MHLAETFARVPVIGNTSRIDKVGRLILVISNLTEIPVRDLIISSLLALPSRSHEVRLLRKHRGRSLQARGAHPQERVHPVDAAGSKLCRGLSRRHPLRHRLAGTFVGLGISSFNFLGSYLLIFVTLLVATLKQILDGGPQKTE